MVTGRISYENGYIQAVGIKVGKWSFPKLKIPHQSHADFCSTDTAGQRATVKAEMNGLTPGLDRHPPSR